MNEDTTAFERRPRGFFQTLAGLYVSPGEEFVSILRDPRFWMPLAGLLALNIAFTAVWLSKVNPSEFLKTQMEESGRWEKIPEDQRETILETQSRVFPIFAWVLAVAAPLVFASAIAGVLLFVFRFFYEGQFDFGRALAIVAWSAFALAVISSPLTLLTMAMKGDWNLNPPDALQANVSMFLDKGSTAKPLYALASSFDLFSFWTIFLLASGFGVATRRSVSGALPGILVPWAIIVLIKVGWAAVM